MREPVWGHSFVCPVPRSARSSYLPQCHSNPAGEKRRPLTLLLLNDIIPRALLPFHSQKEVMFKVIPLALKGKISPRVLSCKSLLPSPDPLTCGSVNICGASHPHIKLTTCRLWACSSQAFLKSPHAGSCAPHSGHTHAQWTSRKIQRINGSRACER